jgi:hypothetical protein
MKISISIILLIIEIAFRIQCTAISVMMWGVLELAVEKQKAIKVKFSTIR